MEAKEILEKLGALEVSDAEHHAALAQSKQEKSELLSELQMKVGKKFVRNGVVHTICQRGALFFLKAPSGAGDIPNLD